METLAFTPPEIVVRYAYEAEQTDHWELKQPVEIVLSDGAVLSIPAGYITDFSSTPRVAWPLFPPVGRQNLASLVHDWMYENRYRETGLDGLGAKAARKFADDEFLRLMDLVANRERTRNKIMYRAVRWFGAGHWGGKNEKSNG